MLPIGKAAAAEMHYLPNLNTYSIPIAYMLYLTLHNYASEFRSCVKVEVAVLDSPTLTVLKVSVDAKQH